jgi:hypothetical protein
MVIARYKKNVNMPVSWLNIKFAIYDLRMAMLNDDNIKYYNLIITLLIKYRKIIPNTIECKRYIYYIIDDYFEYRDPNMQYSSKHDILRQILLSRKC